MGESTGTESEKRTPTLTIPQSYRWLCPWADGDMHQLHLSYKKSLVGLMLAQALVFYGSSAILLLPEDCQASFSFLPAARALSLAGLLTQLIYYRVLSPSNFLSSITPEETRLRAIVFFASLWTPFMPFVLSCIFLCFGTSHAACIPTMW